MWRHEASIAAYKQFLNDLGADEAVYFADAVHPEYQSRTAYVGSQRRQGGRHARDLAQAASVTRAARIERAAAPSERTARP